MLKFKNAVIVILAAALLQSAHGLPSYITKCKKNSPDINECILRSILDAFPSIVEGDAALGIPALTTLNPLDVDLTVNENFIYSLKNIKANSGVLQPTHAKIEFAPLPITLEMEMSLPFLEWDADFEINHKERGQVHIRFDDIRFIYKKQLIESGDNYQVKSLETAGSIGKTELKYNFNSKSKAADQKEVENLAPKIKDAIENRLRKNCEELVAYIMNQILKTTERDNVFLN